MNSLPPDCDDASPTSSPEVAPRGLDDLPPALEGIQRDLLADAAGWSRGVPPATRFNLRLRAALPHDEGADIARHVPGGARVSTYVPGEDADVARTRPAHPHPSRLSAALAMVAAVAVVALLTAVATTLRPRGIASGTSTPAPTPTATLPPPAPISFLPLRATIAQQPGIPVIAANNPDVIYEYGDSTGSPVLRRSDDGGASWHALAYPSAPNTFVSNLVLAVNPANAANVFLEVALGYHPGQPGACTSSQPIVKSIVCIGDYASSDYGAHWTLMRYPVPGTLFPNGIVFSYQAGIVQAQGSRVYAAVQYHNTQVQPATEIRIISSADQGKTWRLADAALAADGLHICDFAAAPTGDTLFARTAEVCLGEGETLRQLWRSDDSGAHWRPVKPFSAPYNGLTATLVVASFPDGQVQALYAAVTDITTNLTSFAASLDGGMSWQPAPSAGLPAGATPALLAGQTLRDGSLVAAFWLNASSAGSPSATAAPAPPPSPTPTATPPDQNARGVVACYAWKPSLARWVPLTLPAATGAFSPTNLYVADDAQRAVVLTLGNPSTTTDATYTIQRFA